MKKYHTIIVGAGPGGLSCACALAKAGQEVLVLERKDRVGPKVCAGGITSTGLGSCVDAGLVERAFAEQCIVSPWQRITISASTPIVSTVNRERLGQWMLGAAVQAGAEVRTGVQVQGIARDHVLAGAEPLGYEYLVGADGSTSLVRRHLRLGTKRLGIGVQYVVPGEFPAMEWHMDPSLFGNGYAWIFPHKGRASIGAYAEQGPMTGRRLLDGLNHWCLDKGIIVRDLKPEAALVNCDYQGWRFGRTFLVGDAAGLASGLTGEGIYPAMVSGETVARTILDSQYDDTRLQRIVGKQRLHARVLAATRLNGLLCRLITELLVLGLRVGAIHFSSLEMRD